MTSMYFRVLFLVAVLPVASTVLCSAEDLPPIAPNNNRTPAGELTGGVLTIKLELRQGRWHPESDDGGALSVYAFGEAGRTLQNPGPLIRVPQGTDVHAIVHNALPAATTVHGLHEMGMSEKEPIPIQPGETREVRFKSGPAGTYYYWATTTGRSVGRRAPVETQLNGAFIVDLPGEVAKDRIFLISEWYPEAASFGGSVVPFEGIAAAINGKTWPYTERFTFKVGERVRWRWLNPDISAHAMHLHGFYFHIQGDGDGKRYQAFAEAERPQVVTKMVAVGGTFDMTWVPERAGRWLFHCHLLSHMSPSDWQTASERQRQDGTTSASGRSSTTSQAAAPEYADERSPNRGHEGSGQDAHDGSRAHMHSEEDDRSGMGGLVLGITVEGEEEASLWHADRKLQLIISERKDARWPLYALEARDVPRAQTQLQPQTGSPSPSTSPASPDLTGPPIVLTRGQPVEIEVVNRTKQPTAIHWHGIEIESYYDGVAGWTGTAQQTTPAVQPGGSFIVQMAPPRAGTFIYHTHWHDRTQLENGIYGPLIVLPPSERFDPAIDKIFLIGFATVEPFGATLLVNGKPEPAPLQLRIGQTYRFRVINITPDNVAARVSLRKSGIPIEWRTIAKDGIDMPGTLAKSKTADLPISVGETYDFEYQAGAPEELSFEVYLPGPKLRVTQALVFTADQPTN